MIAESRSVPPKQNHCPKPTLHCNMFCNIYKKEEEKRCCVGVEQKIIMTYEEELYSEEKIIERRQQLEQLLHRVGPIARKRLRIRIK